MKTLLYSFILLYFSVQNVYAQTTIIEPVNKIVCSSKYKDPILWFSDIKTKEEIIGKTNKLAIEMNVHFGHCKNKGKSPEQISYFAAGIWKLDNWNNKSKTTKPELIFRRLSPTEFNLKIHLNQNTTLTSSLNELTYVLAIAINNRDQVFYWTLSKEPLDGEDTASQLILEQQM